MDRWFVSRDEAPRLSRERETITRMMWMYCRDQHGSRDRLCESCGHLLEYAMLRLDRCVYQAGKPTCAKCPIHCYQKDRREEMRAMMRYSGPRMLFSHPYLAILHLLDGLKKAPVAAPRRKKPSGEGRHGST